ncbi:MAG: hypothetical protein M1400_00925 [Patescibacteria group bacterium]|nr:hypothetical protein [Patescibacteria group bacterium]
MENTAMTVPEKTAETAATPRGIELAQGKILPGGIWEINPFNEESVHPDDLKNPIGA